jgi:spermidine/putrescine transport system substrate-binding protein
VTDPRDDTLNIIAPLSKKAKLDELTRQVYRDASFRLSRREILGAGAVALLAAACGGTTNSGGGSSGGSSSSGAPADTLAGKPVENSLVIYNWSEYDANSTYSGFDKKYGVKFTKTYYSSNDELLAKLHAGGGGYDIIVPSQNAVGELVQENGLMALDWAKIPNIKNLDPAFRKPSYDPTGNYHVIKDYGITMFFYNNKIVTEQPKSMLDFYHLLPKYGKVGRTNLMDGAEEIVPLALMALGLDPNTDNQDDLNKATDLLMSVRSGVTTIDSSGYIDDGIAGKIILGQGWNGDVRRIVQARKKQGDITPVIPTGASEIWADNWCIPANAPHPVAAHAWINWLLVPTVAVNEMNYHSYPIPIPAALDMMPADVKNDPLFNVPAKYTSSYKYILNPSPEVVNARTKIFNQFKAA